MAPRRSIRRAALALVVALSATGVPTAAGAVSGSSNPAAPASPAAVVADGGPDRIAATGTRVVLDARRSAGAVWYRWRQVLTPGAAPVALVNADSPVAHFVMPAGTGGVRLALVVTGPGGTSTDLVDVVQAPTRAVLISSATWTAANGRWVVTGRTSTVTPVTVRLGGPSGPVVGTVLPDPMGRFTVARTSTALRGTTYRAVHARTSGGFHQLATTVL